MKKIFYLIFCISLFNLACSNKQSQKVTLKDSIPTPVENKILDGLKNISDYQLGLLGSKVSKAYEILGEPDEKGESNSGRSGHFVYFDKTKENGMVKHLVIYYNYDNRYSADQTIKQVSAISDGTYFSQQGYGSIKITKPKGFGEELKDLDKTTINIKNQYKAIDTNKLSKLDAEENGERKIFYYTDRLKLVMVKESHILDGGDIVTTAYFFIDDKIRYITKEDSEQSFMVEEKVIVNNRVVRYLIDGKISECKIDCDYNKYSNVYHLLDDFNKNWEGDD